MKEVIFHFFPSARFLGLSLKILFHKNKEIKRMLSKKMTFSLMSLITLLAFAFVAPFATAGVLGDKFATTITLDHTDPPGAQVCPWSEIIRSKQVTYLLRSSSAKRYTLWVLILRMLIQDGH